MSSEYASYIYVHTNTEESSDHNNLQSSCNDEPMFDYHTPGFSIDNMDYCRIICQLDPSKSISRMVIEKNI